MLYGLHVSTARQEHRPVYCTNMKLPKVMKSLIIFPKEVKIDVAIYKKQNMRQ